MAERCVRFCDSVEALAEALAAAVPRPTAVVGVGNPLAGDDGFGPAVAAALVPPPPGLRVFDVRAVPESFLGPIAAAGCPGVLFVDAASLGAEPGRLALVPADRLAEVDVSTHVVSLALTAEAIRRLVLERTGGPAPRSALLAVEPADLKAPDRLSPPVARAVATAAEALRRFAAGPSGPETKETDPA